jgi:TPR repeat protein
MAHKVLTLPRTLFRSMPILLMIGHSAASAQSTERSGETATCYVLTFSAVEYRVYAEGAAPECRKVTPGIEERLREYEKGKRPKRIETTEPTFFDPRTGEPAVWYYKDKNGDIQLFDLMGFHPETGEELQPITKDVVAEWKTQQADRKARAAQRPPQRIDPETYAFFDPLTGKARVWYVRTPSGEYQFYDNPGYDPETGEPLSIISKEVIDAWRSPVPKQEAKRCYVITRDEHQPVRYGEQSGIDPDTGRQCRELTPEVVERLREYEKGNRPKRIEAAEPTFFDLRTGEPVVWYYKDKNGDIQLFDLMGFHPESGEELLPITKEVVTQWKAQQDERKRRAAQRPPHRIDPQKYAFFDPLTGKARVWYVRTPSGEYQFYDNSGYDPETGEPLSIITKEVIDAWRAPVPKREAKRCYVITRDEHQPVRYFEQPGIDPETGRQCRELTREVVERLREYEKGNRPKRIEAAEPTFFDLRTGEPVVWYYKDKNGDIQLFDLMGFHPETGEELVPVTKEVVAQWKAQSSRRVPEKIPDPDKYGAFDPVTGKARLWYFRAQNGAYEFYDGPGFHPATGEALTLATRETIDEWKQYLEKKGPGAPARSPNKVEIKADTQFFDPKTGAHLLWYWRGKKGEYEFFDGPGFHPRNGDALKPATREALEAYQLELKEVQDEFKREQDRLKREEQARHDADERKKAEQQKRDEEAAKQREQELRRLSESERACDELAANPSDVHRVGQGVPYGALKPQAAEAVAACESAAKQNPGELRFAYQLARALEVEGEGSERARNRQRAFELHRQLVAKGYSVAFDNLGSIYRDRNDLPRAVALFRQGIQAGDTDSMLSFAELVERRMVAPANSTETPLELYRRAAELGNENAGRAYEQEMARQNDYQQQRLRQLEQQRMMMQFLGTVLQNVHRR